MRINIVKTLAFSAVSLFIMFPGISKAQDGAALFKSTCAVCHTVGKGRLVGPDLKGIEARLDEAWIIDFVKSSESVINSGDAYADSIFQAYNQVPMPDQNLTDDEIKAIIAYIASEGAPAGDEVAEAEVEEPAPVVEVEGDAERGRKLFVGHIGFENGGPTCNSCHNVDNSEIITGGAMAKDLTTVLSRMAPAAAKAFIVGLPIAMMKQSYENHPVTDEEANDLIAFLAETNQLTDQKTNQAGMMLITYGLAGAALVIILFALFWMKRRKDGVNAKIYDRQIKSAY